MVSYYGLLTPFFRNQENGNKTSFKMWAQNIRSILFLFVFSLRREEIRLSGVVGVVSGMGLLLLILQALGCVGEVWLVVESAKCTFFFVRWSTIWEQFIYWTNRRPDWHCCGIEHDRVDVSSELGLLCALWPADECRFPWNPFSSMQYNLQR